MTMMNRPEPGMLLPLDDPRVQAAMKATQPIITSVLEWGSGAFDPRDVAEVVNAVLAADDEIHDRPINWCRTPELIPDPPTERP